MSTELIKRDFWDNLPRIFGTKDLFKFDSEFEKILNGKCDFEEEDDKYVVELEVPGVEKDEINISVKNDILTISWSRKKENKNSKGKGSYERNEGSFTRSFEVDGADVDKINAELKNGVLKILLPKHEGSKPKKIVIN